VTPSETIFTSLKAVPDFVTESIPLFILLIAIETLEISMKKSKYTGIDWSDSISSITAGMLSQLPLLFAKSVEIVFYIWIYESYRLIDLPHDSYIVWFLGMLGVDFGYYWVHRASHEVSLFWAAHQAHHNSQRYNLSTALRQGAFQKYISWIFYLPMSLFLPPTVFVVHLQFNLLYQFWIHTETISTLGPLELIFNTPSHHRVHHGRNKYCIDKNYGGTLIIFDRIFGTFQKEDIKVVYGVVQPIKSWNPVEVQMKHLNYIFQRFFQENGVKNKLKILFYGPGWTKDSKRLGSIDDIPEPEKPTVFYQQNISPLRFLYCFINFLAVNIVYLALATFKHEIALGNLTMATIMIVFTLIQIGRLLDGKELFWTESLRLAIIFSAIINYIIYY